jgi:UPF0176 protein
MSSGSLLRLAASVVASGLLAAATGACGGVHAASSPAEAPAESAESLHAGPPAVAVPPVTPAPGAPPEPQPVADGPCNYLSTAAVQAANGQLVSTVRVSADRPHPACFFLRRDGKVQLRVWIVVATPEVARATVDAAAPVATSDLAELPGGWSGGSQPTSEGAAFAVARRGSAVVITTNQRQTISARQIAEQVIATLGL